jgi:asparagine synthase (glutamine-hydrolysing)
MCGIAGYFGSCKIESRYIEAAFDRLSHRGPDGKGIYQHTTSTGQCIYLLHTRLSIIDLHEHANQPMKLGDHILAFNGELYNYKECRDKLLKEEAIQFHTASDTEVFLNMFIRQGVPKALEEAEGMWALAFYNEITETLYLSRDRFGEKPLFYLEKEHGIYFASEINALFALSGEKQPINHQKLSTYLFMGYRSLYKDDDTFFQSIKLLGSQQYVEIQKGKIIAQKQYWFPNRHLPTFSSTNDAVKDIKEKLISAVELRLRSDVPIAFCMSGGVDSLTLISIAKKIFGYDVHGFTIQNSDDRYNESELVNYAVGELGINHTFVGLDSGGFLNNLTGMIKHRAAPIATISYYVHRLLMEQIKKAGYKVSISGTGADELFTGYYDHFLLHLACCENGTRTQNLLDWEKYIKPYIRNPIYHNPRLFMDTPAYRAHLHKDYSDYAPPQVLKEFKEKTMHVNLLRNRMLNELFEEVVPVILFEDDNNSMSYSIENRSPFLDTGLLTSSFRIPPELMIQKGYGKYILREAVSGILPEKARVNTRKVGFNSSLMELLNLNDSSVRETLFSKDSPIFSYVDRDKVIELFNKKDPPEKFLFNFIGAQIFLEQFES